MIRWINALMDGLYEEGAHELDSYVFPYQEPHAIRRHAYANMNFHGDKSITNFSVCKVNKEKCLSQQTWNGGNPRDFILNMHAWPLSVESRVHVRIEA